MSELIKRIAFLQGLIPDPTKKQGAKTPEEELAEFLLQKEVAAREAALIGAQAMIEFLTANMAPIMFASLIVFLLFGYSVAFSLAACGLFFGFVGVELGVMQPRPSCKACRCACSASCRTTRCWPFRSSPSWA